jgi:hypothetical protein
MDVIDLSLQDDLVGGPLHRNGLLSGQGPDQKHPEKENQPAFILR